MENSKYINTYKLIEKTIKDARDILLKHFTEMFNGDVELATATENDLYVKASSEMRSRFSFITKTNSIYEYDYDPNFYTELYYYYPDFANWSWTAFNVIFYQTIGDTIGYNNGKWEFNYGNQHQEPEYVNELIYDFIYLGGINDIQIINLKASDDTILYFATLKVLLDLNLTSVDSVNVNDYGKKLQESYIKLLPKIINRHPGVTIVNSLEIQKNIEWKKLPYDSRAIGAGAAMRSGCIGILYPGINNRYNLIIFAIESSRITHNSAISILASVTSALFTAFALERRPLNNWVNKLLKVISYGDIDSYIKSTYPDQYKEYARDKVIFVGQWKKYLELFGDSHHLDTKMMKNLVLRYKYLSENFSKGCDIPGSCGDDCLIFAYDSLTRCNGSIEKLLFYSILHPGDSDTIGSIAFSWYGAYYGSPKNDPIMLRLKKNVEFRNKFNKYFPYIFNRLIRCYYFYIYIDIAFKFYRKTG